MVEPVAPAELAAALEPGNRELMALVGGGGKTATLLGLGRCLRGRTVLTTTTRTGAGQTAAWPTLTDPDDHEIASALIDHPAVFVRRSVAGGKSIGVLPEACDRWLATGLADRVVVEADGAAMRPFTAPRPHEPVIPAHTSMLVACIGADALGRVIADQCHSPLRVAAVAGCSPYQRLTPARAARVLLDARGSRKSCPAGARFVVLVTKVDAATRPLADELVELVGLEAEVVLVAFDRALAADYPAPR